MQLQRNEMLSVTVKRRRAERKPATSGRTRPRFTLALLATLTGMICAPPVIAAPLQVPALVDPPSTEHHVGKVVFVELVTPDLAASEDFYGHLFGWTFRDIQAPGIKYAEATLDGRPVAGLVQRRVPAGQHRQPAWLSFFSVRDVDAAKKVALQNGAKVLFDPHSLPERGREAVFADPQGAVFAVLASTSGDPPDLLAEPGEWIWSSLLTSDADTDAAFYQKLFSYEVFDAPADGGARHLMLASDGYSRASANTLPALPPPDRAHPHWLNFIRVDDVPKATANIIALGGTVLVEPRVDRHGGQIAVVADPLGAAFGLLEWVATDSDQVQR